MLENKDQCLVNALPIYIEHLPYYTTQQQSSDKKNEQMKLKIFYINVYILFNVFKKENFSKVQKKISHHLLIIGRK